MNATIRSILNFFKLIISGEILLKLGIGRAFPYILFAFVLGWLNILLNYKMEQTLIVAEQSRVKLENMKIFHAQKTCEYAGFYRLSTVEEMLRQKESEVKAPEKPANIIKR